MIEFGSMPEPERERRRSLSELTEVAANNKLSPLKMPTKQADKPTRTHESRANAMVVPISKKKKAQEAREAKMERVRIDRLYTAWKTVSWLGCCTSTPHRDNAWGNAADDGGSRNDHPCSDCNNEVCAPNQC